MDDPAAVPDLVETTLRVATWNLWWRFGPWEERFPLILDALRTADADLIALQEVWHDGTTSSAHLLGEALGMEAAFAGDLELSEGVRFGNAVLSRWPIAATAVVPLPAAERPSEGRLVLRADIDGPRGPVQLYSTHLNWRFDHSAVRQAQVRALAELVATSGPRSYPPIVCGDFNAEPHSDEIELLTGQREPAADGLVLVDAWHAVRPTDVGFTWDNDNPFVASQLEWNRRIDYVFAGWPKAGGRGNPRSAALLGTIPTDGCWPSDHFGVVVDLRY